MHMTFNSLPAAGERTATARRWGAYSNFNKLVWNMWSPLCAWQLQHARSEWNPTPGNTTLTASAAMPAAAAAAAAAL